MAPTRRPEYSRALSQRQRGVPAPVPAPVPVPAPAPPPVPNNRGVEPKVEAGSSTPQPPSRIAFTPMDIDSSQGSGSSTRIVIDLTIDEAQEPVVQCHRVEPSGQASAPAENAAPDLAHILRRLSRVEEGQTAHEAALEGVYVSLADLSSRSDRDEESNRQRHTEVVGLLNKQVDVMTGLTERMDQGERQREEDRQRHEEQREEERKRQQKLYTFLEGGMHTIVQNMGWQYSAPPPTAPGRPRASAGPSSSRAVTPNATRAFFTGTSPRPAYNLPRDARGRRKKPQASNTRGRNSARAPTPDTASLASTFSGTPRSTPPESPGGGFGAPTSAPVLGVSAPAGTARYASRFPPPVPSLAGNHAGDSEESDGNSWTDESTPTRATRRVTMRGALSRGAFD